MNAQRGSALILSLLILLVMTMLGIAAMSTSTLEERMAANDRNQKLAFQNAETALSQTETEVLNYHWNSEIKGFLNDDEIPGFYAEDTPPNYYQPSTWETGADCDVAIENNQATSNACRVVHIMDEAPALEPGGYGQPSQANMPVARLRITAQGRDAGGNARVMVQSTLEKNIIP